MSVRDLRGQHLEFSDVCRVLGAGDWPFGHQRTKAVLSSKCFYGGFLSGNTELGSNGAEFAYSLGFSTRQVISNVTSFTMYTPTSSTDITLQNTTNTSICDQKSINVYSLLVVRTQKHYLSEELNIRTSRTLDHFGVVAIDTAQRAEVIYANHIEMVIQIQTQISLQFRPGFRPYQTVIVSVIRFDRGNLIQVFRRISQIVSNKQKHIRVSTQSTLITVGSQAVIVIKGYRSH